MDSNGPRIARRNFLAGIGGSAAAIGMSSGASEQDVPGDRRETPDPTSDDRRWNRLGRS